MIGNVEFLNTSFIKFYIMGFIVFWIITRPVAIPFNRRMKDRGKSFPIRLLSFFYIPKGKKAKPLYIHIMGVATGITFFIASIISFPLFLLLTWLGYTNSSGTITNITLVLVILYIFTLVINNYRRNIEEFVESKTKLDVRG